MDKQNSTTEALSAAWRALGSTTVCEGWRTIPIAVEADCRVLAGRHFPGNQEAILVGLRQVRKSAVESLPEGNGFAVRILDLPIQPENHTWFALIRQLEANPDIFAMMASDVVSTLSASDEKNHDRLFDLFLGRIHAWQAFMLRGMNGVLSEWAEVGLHGELILLGLLIQSGMTIHGAIEAWYGPLDGIQDFRIGTGGIEVKTTISGDRFSATISSLEQLDDSSVNPLYLAGIQLRLHQEGMNLPERATSLRGLLLTDPLALDLFESRLLSAGFFPAMAKRYPRRFVHDNSKFFRINEEFPTLTNKSVPAGITSVRYKIDLDSIRSPEIRIENILQSLGVV